MPEKGSLMIATTGGESLCCWYQAKPSALSSWIAWNQTLTISSMKSKQASEVEYHATNRSLPSEISWNSARSSRYLLYLTSPTFKRLLTVFTVNQSGKLLTIWHSRQDSKYFQIVVFQQLMLPPKSRWPFSLDILHNEEINQQSTVLDGKQGDCQI